MIVTETVHGFIISRKPEGPHFSFFVDHDRSSWSKRIWEARKYKTKMAATRDMEDIKRRDKMRREERHKANAEAKK